MAGAVGLEGVADKGRLDGGPDGVFLGSRSWRLMGL